MSIRVTVSFSKSTSQSELFTRYDDAMDCHLDHTWTGRAKEKHQNHVENGGCSKFLWGWSGTKRKSGLAKSFARKLCNSIVSAFTLLAMHSQNCKICLVLSIHNQVLMCFRRVKPQGYERQGVLLISLFRIPETFSKTIFKDLKQLSAVLHRMAYLSLHLLGES